MTQTATLGAVLRADAMLVPGEDGSPFRVIAPAECVIDDEGRIAYAGPPRDTSRPTHELTGQVLMPGLVNGHTHSAMTLMRGVSDDEGFMPWLAAVQGVEQGMTRDDVVAGVELAMLEMIATGTTAFADMYHWDAGLLRLVSDAGMRVFAAPACLGAEVVGFPGVSFSTGTEVLDETEALAEQFAGDPRIRLGYGPHAPYTCAPELLRDIRDRALRTGIPVQIHVSESAAEVADITDRYGATPGRHLAALGLFDAEVLAAHCVHLTAGEITTFADHGAAISHNPVSNLKLGCGIAPLPAFLDAGVRLALGTDSVASNNSLDLFEEIKTATILHRGVHQDAAIVRGSDVLDIATRRGAAAIGFPDAGAVEVGRFADVITLDISGAAQAPFTAERLVSHLAFAASGRDVRHVFIGGRHVYADGDYLTLDAAGILARARASAARLRATA
ncbi:MAG: amidohydrolase [Propioniciclava sp.]|uniref:amidohydrolase family protein n=1 Tax=Propioniciclava sp. TaxID=2038686 RepID=UPI0039E29EED